MKVWQVAIWVLDNSIEGELEQADIMAMLQHCFRRRDPGTEIRITSCVERRLPSDDQQQAG